jgi:hypothetical protein
MDGEDHVDRFTLDIRHSLSITPAKGTRQKKRRSDVVSRRDTDRTLGEHQSFRES